MWAKYPFKILISYTIIVQRVHWYGFTYYNPGLKNYHWLTFGIISKKNVQLSEWFLKYFSLFESHIYMRPHFSSYTSNETTYCNKSVAKADIGTVLYQAR